MHYPTEPIVPEVTEAVSKKLTLGADGDVLLTLALVVVIALLVVFVVIRKASLSKKADEVICEPIVEAAPAAVAPGSAGKLKLHDVEPKTAAMLMAIVADKLGKPLNELNFISIKEVK